MNNTTAIVVLVVVLALVFMYWRYSETQRLAAQNTPGARIGSGIGNLVGGIIDVAVT